MTALKRASEAAWRASKGAGRAPEGPEKSFDRGGLIRLEVIKDKTKIPVRSYAGILLSVSKQESRAVFVCT